MVKEKYSLNAASIIGLMAFSFLLFVLRRPDIVLHAQPWEEDGRVWMAGIYNNGFWSSLFLLQNGYFQTISRLTYGIALWFGLSKSALVENIIALLIRCFFVGLTLSNRMSFIDIKYRIAIILCFILMPNVAEGFVKFTNERWYKKMFGLLRLRARTSRTLPQSILNC